MTTHAAGGRLPLHDWHRQRGARFGVVLGVEMPLDYGDLEAEYAALDGSCLLDASAADRLELLGEDRARFLNGLVTCEVAALEPGSGAYGFLTTARGRILADATILALDDRFWLRLAPGTGQAVGEHLEKYVVVDRVEVHSLGEQVPLVVLGRGLERCHGLGPDLPGAPWSHRQAQLFGHPVHLVREDHRGADALAVWVRDAEGPALARALSEQAGLVPIGELAAERLRIVAGIPRFGLDFSDENLPQETGLTEAVSYEKGCYLGQEVVARLHYRGRAARLVCRLEIAGEDLPEPGSPLLLEGREAGRLTSVAFSPERGRPVALAMLQRRAAEEGTRLQLVGGGAAEVVSAGPRLAG